MQYHGYVLSEHNPTNEPAVCQELPVLRSTISGNDMDITRQTF